ILARLDFANSGFTGPRLLQAQNEILRRARELQGVRSASTSLTTPISGLTWNDVLVVPGYTPGGFRDALAFFNEVSDGYFTTLGTRLLAGRDFVPADQGRPA